MNEIIKELYNIEERAGQIVENTQSKKQELERRKQEKEEQIEAKKTIEDGTYKITMATAPNQSLTVDGGKTFNGANIHIWNYVNSPQQQFKIKYDDEGYCEIIPVHSNKRIDVAGWGNEANVDQWEYNGRK